VGVPIQKENGPEARGEENEEEVPLLIQLWGLGERHELSQRGSEAEPRPKTVLL